MKKKEEETAAQEQPSHFSNAVARVDTPANFKAVRRLTRDVTSITRVTEAIVLVQSEMYNILMPDPAHPGEKRPVPAVDVLDCIRGDEYTLICGAVLASTWKRWNGNLTGNYFAIRTGEIPSGKHYRKVDVVHLERAE